MSPRAGIDLGAASHIPSPFLRVSPACGGRAPAGATLYCGVVRAIRRPREGRPLKTVECEFLTGCDGLRGRQRIERGGGVVRAGIGWGQAMSDAGGEGGLRGQVALVTGAAQGLGYGIAAELARRGAFVVIADLQGEKAEHAARELGGAAVQVDVACSASVDRCFAALMAAHGRLDILVNSAGVGQTVAPVSELPDAEWERVLGVTLTGSFYCCRAVARIMERQESGCIVNIASVNGQNPAALVAAYNAAKAGVISLTRTLALELAAYGVRVNAVSPGPVYTDFNKTVMAQRCRSLGLTEEQMIERIRSAIPLGRWGEAADIANSVAFLCSPQAAWITGEVLRVSGGLEGVSAAPPKRPR